VHRVTILGNLCFFFCKGQLFGQQAATVCSGVTEFYVGNCTDLLYSDIESV
jgi:hypothetical protein